MHDTSSASLAIILWKNRINGSTLEDGVLSYMFVFVSI